MMDSASEVAINFIKNRASPKFQFDCGLGPRCGSFLPFLGPSEHPMFQSASSQSDPNDGGRYRSLLRIINRIWPRWARVIEKDELFHFVNELLKGCQDNEEKVLLLANWTTIAIRDEPPEGSGVIATFRERKGRCGARARLFVALAERAGLNAKVFGIYSKGLRHTAAQFMLNGKWCFVDPMYGGVFRGDNGLLDFEQVLSDPDRLFQMMTPLHILPEADGTWISLSDRTSKLQSLYSASNLRNVNAYGFLYDKKPIVYQLQMNLQQAPLPVEINTKNGGHSEFMRSASRLLGAPLPNSIGASNRRIAHEWDFREAIVGKHYAVSMKFRTLPKVPLQIEVTSEGAAVVSSADVSLASAAGLKAMDIVLLAEQPCFKVQVAPVFKKWAHTAEISSITIKQLSERERAPVLATKGHGRTRRAEITAASTSAALLKYLNEDCGITTVVRSGTFGDYGKRPRNWAWIFHGTAAIFAYRATGDRGYLRWLAEMFDEMMRFRDSETGRVDEYRKRRYRSWGAQVKDRRAGGTVWINEVCTGGCMALPAALFAAEVQADPSLQAEFGERAGRFIDVCTAVVDEFGEDVRDVPGLDQSYFIMPHDGEPEPLAHAAPFAAMLAALYRASEQTTYLELATRLRNYFKASISSERDGAWSWPYRPTPGQMTGAGEFFFKARVTLTFPIHAYALGLLFDEVDMKQFANTFLTAVARGDGRYFTTVSTRNGKQLDNKELLRFRDKGRSGSLAQLAGFYPLACANPDVANRIEDFISSKEELFPRGWFSTPSSVEAYAVRLGLDAAMERWR